MVAFHNKYHPLETQKITQTAGQKLTKNGFEKLEITPFRYYYFDEAKKEKNLNKRSRNPYSFLLIGGVKNK